MLVTTPPKPALKVRQPAPPEKNPGWSISLAGTVPGLTNAVRFRTDIPKHWKDAICGDLETGPASFNFVRLDVHCHPHHDRVNLHYSIVRSSALVS